MSGAPDTRETPFGRAAQAMIEAERAHRAGRLTDSELAEAEATYRAARIEQAKQAGGVVTAFEFGQRVIAAHDNRKLPGVVVDDRPTKYAYEVAVLTDHDNEVLIVHRYNVEVDHGGDA